MNPNNYISDCCGVDVEYDKKNDWLYCYLCEEPCAGKPRTLGVTVEDSIDVKESIQ